MIKLRKLEHNDFDDIVDIAKNIWGGTDYLPKIFHKWVDDKGYFLGAEDTDNNKIIGVGKYSILHDKTGWLEGLRVHSDYRGQKISKQISEKLLNIAKEELEKGNINKIGFGTYIENIESITMMSKMGFKIEEQLYLLHKEYEFLDSALSIEDFKVEPWNISYDEFANLPYIQRRSGYFDMAFVFQNPTIELFNELKEAGSFVTINGYNGIFKLKGEPNFSAVDETFEAIDTFMNYYLLKFRDTGYPCPVSTLSLDKCCVIEQLRQAKFGSWSDWQVDYLYYIYK
jgi:RimJ/RimL family protein N-acetyltransferase